jgi:hypothetical protein
MGVLYSWPLLELLLHQIAWRLDVDMRAITLLLLVLVLYCKRLMAAQLVSVRISIFRIFIHIEVNPI